MTGYLTTHILDTATGVPAEGVEIDLYKVSGNSHKKIATTVTNDDGRTDTPILPEEKFEIGMYELVFKVGDYLRSTVSDDNLSDGPMFLEEIPIRFGMAQEDHYHVPLLLSPYGYSTYRGS